MIKLMLKVYVVLIVTTMGAFTCNVNMNNAPTKKTFHKKWYDVWLTYWAEDGAWWGMNGYTIHNSFETGIPIKREEWHNIETEWNNQEDAKWKPCLVGLVWKTKKRNPALKKYIKCLEELNKHTPPLVSKEEWDEYKEWQKVGSKWKPSFFMNDNKKADEIMKKYSELEVYFANYTQNSKKYQKLLNKMPECPVWTAIAAVVPDY